MAPWWLAGCISGMSKASDILSLKDNERISFVYVTVIVGDSNQTLGPILTKFCTTILRRNISVEFDWANRFKMATNLNICETKWIERLIIFLTKPNHITPD